MMYRLALSAVLAAVCCAQTQPPSDLFTRAPKALDDALRARMTEFYQAHIDAKYRQAEALVADDTKDFFYSANKPKYLSFEIRSIEYSAEYTRAKATVIVEQFVMVPGFTDKPLKMPTPSYWKLDNGKWCWYVDQQAIRKTPFGKVSEDMGKGGAMPAGKIPVSIEASGIQAQVKVDKQTLTIAKDKPGTFEVANTALGPVKLTVWDAPVGVDLKVAKFDLAPGEKTTVNVGAGAMTASQGVVRLKVEPTNQLLAVRVYVGKGPEAVAEDKSAEPAAPPVLAPFKTSGPETQLKADRDTVTIRRQGVETVSIVNTAPGPVYLAVWDMPAGLDFILDQRLLQPGQKATATVKFGGMNVSEGVVRLRVSPTNQVLTIRVILNPAG